MPSFVSILVQVGTPGPALERDVRRPRQSPALGDPRPGECLCEQPRGSFGRAIPSRLVIRCLSGGRAGAEVVGIEYLFNYSKKPGV